MTSLLFVEDEIWGNSELFADNDEGLERAKAYARTLKGKILADPKWRNNSNRLCVDRLKANSPFHLRDVVWDLDDEEEEE